MQRHLQKTPRKIAREPAKQHQKGSKRHPKVNQNVTFNWGPRAFDCHMLPPDLMAWACHMLATSHSSCLKDLGEGSLALLRNEPRRTTAPFLAIE